MRKLAFILGLVLITTVGYASTTAFTNEVTSQLIADCDDCDDKKCKGDCKKDGEKKTCSSSEKKACEGKKAEAKKACCSKDGEKKSCHKKTEATTEESTEE
jgi:hypothetical protein